MKTEEHSEATAVFLHKLTAAVAELKEQLFGSSSSRGASEKVLGILFISAEILGRMYLVSIGTAPSTGGDAIKIVIGGVIAFGLILYVSSQWKRLE